MKRSDLILIAKSPDVERMLAHPFPLSVAQKISYMMDQFTKLYEIDIAPKLGTGEIEDGYLSKEYELNIPKIAASELDGFTITPSEVDVFKIFVDFDK